MRTLTKSILLTAGLAALTPGHATDAPASDPAAATTSTADTAALGPQELMVQVSQSLLRELEKNREELRRDPARLRAVVDANLLPHFDTNYAGQLVLGKHWREATPAQRKRFVNAFYQSLMKNYGDALLDFTADRMRILPFRGDPAAKTATVRTEVKRSNGTPVPVNYSLRRTASGWKAWDVTIEGISYVKNYRNDIGAEVAAKGIDAVIARLEAQNASAEPTDAPGTATGKSQDTAKPAATTAPAETTRS